MAGGAAWNCIHRTRGKVLLPGRLVEMSPYLRHRQSQTPAVPVLFHPGKVRVVYGRCGAGFIQQLASQVIEEVHVRSGRGDGGMKTLRDQYRLAISHREDLIEILILPVIAVNAKTIGRCEAVVIDLLQVRRTSIAIVAVRGPAAP